MGDGHGDGGQVARLRRISDAVPFFSVVLLISRVSFNGSPHVVLPLWVQRSSSCLSGERGAEWSTTCAKLQRARAQRWSQTVPSPRRGGTDGESKRGAASERTPLSSAIPAPDTAGQEAGVRWAPVKANRAFLQRLTPQKQGNSPKGQRGTDPRNKVGTVPRTGRAPTQGLAFQVPYAVLLYNVRHLKLSEVSSPAACRR